MKYRSLNKNSVKNNVLKQSMIYNITVSITVIMESPKQHKSGQNSTMNFMSLSPGQCYSPTFPTPSSLHIILKQIPRS